MNTYTLEILPMVFAVARLTSTSLSSNNWKPAGSFYACIQEQEELTIVCEEELLKKFDEAELGWRVLKIQGILEFSLVGILAGIANVLAKAGVSIFTLSTYHTDFILIKDEMLQDAVNALRQSNYDVIEG